MTNFEFSSTIIGKFKIAGGCARCTTYKGRRARSRCLGTRCLGTFAVPGYLRFSQLAYLHMRAISYSSTSLVRACLVRACLVRLSSTRSLCSTRFSMAKIFIPLSSEISINGLEIWQFNCLHLLKCYQINRNIAWVPQALLLRRET